MIRPDHFVEAPSNKIPGTPLDWNLSFQVPGICPNCGGASHPRVMAFSYLNMNAGQFGVLSIKCQQCKSAYIACYHIEALHNHCKFVSMYPNPGAIEIHSEILLLSPLFVELFRQALDCEGQDHLALAIHGLVRAMHVLVSDYAIKVLHKKPRKVIKKSLPKAIKKYLPKVELIKPRRMAQLMQSESALDYRLYSPKDYHLLRENTDMLLKKISKRAAKSRKNKT